MKLEQAVDYLALGYKISRVEWDDNEYVNLSGVENFSWLCKVKDGVSLPYEFTKEDKTVDDWFATDFTGNGNFEGSNTPAVMH